MRTTDFNDNNNDDKNFMPVECKQALSITESSNTHEVGHYKQGPPWRDKNTSLTHNMVMAATYQGTSLNNELYKDLI